jgi:predicted permease
MRSNNQDNDNNNACGMVGLAHCVHLDNESGRVAVLIATLPISLESFSLAHQYDAGKAELSTTVATGTFLCFQSF